MAEELLEKPKNICWEHVLVKGCDAQKNTHDTKIIFRFFWARIWPGRT